MQAYAYHHSKSLLILVKKITKAPQPKAVGLKLNTYPIDS